MKFDLPLHFVHQARLHSSVPAQAEPLQVIHTQQMRSPYMKRSCQYDDKVRGNSNKLRCRILSNGRSLYFNVLGRRSLERGAH